MAKFITRVQLQEASPIDFEKLDIEMERESFTRADQSADAFTVIREKRISLQ